MNPKHILLPTDLSEISLRPLEHNPELFEGRQVTLLSVVPNFPVLAPASPFAPPVDSPDLGPRMESAREGLKAIADRFPANADVRTEAIAERDSGPAIAHWARDNDVDLIVVSTHGRTGFRRLTLGSVAESVLRHSTVPVLAFPEKENQK
ncbi:MAG: universal stress protein [Planctomycetota bacterium]